jgi:hypothetical protein
MKQVHISRIHPDNILPGLQGSYLTAPFLDRNITRFLTPRVQKYISMYHLDIGLPGETDNDEEIPVIKKPKLVIPGTVWPFHQVKDHISPTTGAHFFVDDNIIMRFIRHPKKYIETLKQCCCVLSLDLSTYQEFRLPVIRHNVFLNRLYTQELQQNDINTIPVVQWRDKKSFSFCFLGIPKGSVIAISTMGVRTNAISLSLWKEGMKEAIKQIEPEAILLYGESIDFNFGNIDVFPLPNMIIRRMRKNGR